MSSAQRATLSDRSLGSSRPLGDVEEEVPPACLDGITAVLPPRQWLNPPQYRGKRFLGMA
jgi:hypothetical protein